MGVEKLERLLLLNVRVTWPKMGIKTTENKHGFKKYSEVKLIGFKSSSSV
jgi:hypothetical protein